MEINKNEIYTVKEIAQILKMSEDTVRKRIRAASLPAIKVGGRYRILGSEILKLFRKKIILQIDKKTKKFIEDKRQKKLFT